jgi:hypothetical protein
LVRLIAGFEVGCKGWKRERERFLPSTAACILLWKKKSSDLSADLCRLYMLFAEWL